MWASLQGEMGMIVFTEAPGGTIAREHNPNPRKSTSPAVLAVRARFKRVAAFWNALTDLQQEGWDAWALLQERDPHSLTDPTGYSLFSSLANVWLQARNDQGTPPASPPTGEYGGSPGTISAAATANTVTFSGPVTPKGTTVQFELQPLKRSSRKPSTEGYRVVGFAPITEAGQGQVSFTVKPGAFAARYAYVELASGRRTSFTEIPVSGVALAVEQGGADERPAARKKAA